MLLANTYHLHLRPGDDLIARAGGLHRFIGWDRPILTDSGGYQVFSLAANRDVTDIGVRFRSHLDGREVLLTPERVVEIQARLGPDIAMVLDECVAYPIAPGEARRAVSRTLRWAERARARMDELRAGAGDVEITNPGQAMFGIVQGGVDPHLRESSCRATVALEFDGYAIGGLSVGEPVDLMYRVVEEVAPRLPAESPRYLMGAGMPDDIVESVARGIDLFDCVIPTRNARNGQLLTRRGRIVIKHARFADDHRPPDPECGCYTCGHFSRAYLRHLYMANEMAAATLNTLHNLYFYLDTMDRIRKAIAFGAFGAFRQAFHETFTRRSVTEP